MTEKMMGGITRSREIMNDFTTKYAEMYESGKSMYEANPYMKEENEYVKRAEYYYGMYSAGHCVIGPGGFKNYGERIDFKTLRDHARGVQDVSKYQDILDPLCEDSNGNLHRSWNINWRTSKVLAKYRDRMVSKFRKVLMEPVIMATDDSALMAKDLLVGKLKMITDGRTQQFSEETGYPVDNPLKGLTPQDVDIYNDLGGITLPPEVDMKDAVDDAMDSSQWDSISKLLFEDKIELGAYVYHVYKKNNKIRVEYVDPQGYFRRFSEYPDGRDSDFKAFVKTRRLSEIRHFVDDQDKLDKIKNAYRGAGWRTLGNGRREDYDRSGDYVGYPYDEESVQVMTLYFVDTQLELHAKGMNRRGSRVYDPVSPDTSFDARHNREVVKTPVQYLFKCNWVVGTDIVYDYGMADVIVREGEPGSKEVVIPLYDHISQEPSIIERCIGFDDDIQIATFKLRNNIKKMIPGPGIAVNKSAIKGSVTFGKEKMSVRDSMKKLYSDGMFFYETLMPYDLPGIDDKNSWRQFIDFLPPVDVNKLTILHQEIERGEMNIRNVTGSNPLEDGQGQPDMLKHTAQSMIMGTNDAIAPHIDDFAVGFGRMAYIMCHMYRIMVLSGDITIRNKRKFTLTKDLFMRDWNVRVLVDKTKTKEMLLQDLMQMKGQIPSEAYYEIYNAINQHDLRKAQILIAKYSAKAEEIAHQRQLEIQTAQAEGNKAAGIATEQAREKSAITSSEMKQKEMLLQEQIDERKAKADFERKKKLIEIEGKFAYQKDTTIANIQKPAY